MKQTGKLFAVICMIALLLYGCGAKRNENESANITEATSPVITEENTVHTDSTEIATSIETGKEETETTAETTMETNYSELATHPMVAEPTETPNTEPDESWATEEAVTQPTQQPDSDNNKTPDDEL